MTAVRSRSGIPLTIAFVVSVLGPSVAHADTITLLWDPNAEVVAGYAVYVGSSRIDVGNTTTYTMNNAVAGQQYCFAVAAYTTVEGPKSAQVCGYSNRLPVLTNPGNQSSTVGQAATLQLAGSDPDGQPVSYMATGLPAGLSVGTATGFISGTPTTAGTFSVTATTFDGTLTSAPQTFTWTVAAAPADSTAPAISVTSPTSASTFTSTTASIQISGTSSDNVGVTSVAWTNSSGGSGTAIGTLNWNFGPITLSTGANVITVTAQDAAGNVASDVLTVTYTPPDTTAPSISINAPTTSSTYATASSSLTLGGTAADNVGVTQVRWASDRGSAGTASGTSSWSAAITLMSGANVITVTALDAASNQNTDVVTVTYTPPDTSAPTVSILGPTNSPTYTTTSPVMTIGGSAADDRGVTAVTWANDRGGNGFSSGTTSWSVPTVNLQIGTNVITVTAQDAAGNRGTDVLTVDYSPSSTPPAPFVLGGSLYSSGRWKKALLQWSVVPGKDVQVMMNGSVVAKTMNDGSYVDQPRVSAPYTYQICLTGTTTCSNVITLTN